MEGIRNELKFLSGRPAAKRQLRRHRRRLKDIIKEDVKESCGRG
jgi:hypothetical protein